MKPIVLFFVLTGSLLAQRVTNAAFDGVSHSALRMTISYEGEFNVLRARYTPTPASCKDGRTGVVQVISFYQRFAQMPIIISGLQAGTSYEICPELSSDGGSTWSQGFGALVTTQPLPSQHPSLPISPEKFNSSYPDTSAFTRLTTNSDCSDLHDLLMAAIDRSLNSGTVINLPAGRACLVNPFDFNVNPPDVLWFGQDSVSLATNTLTIPRHGLIEGQKIQIANYTPYRGGALPATAPVALANGQTYYAHVLNADAIQVYYEAPANKNGTLLRFTWQGYGNDNYVVPLPRRTKPIIIQTTGASATFLEHVRVGPSNASQMTRLVMPRSQIGRDPRHYLFRFSDLDANVRRPIGNLRFVGIEFTTEDFADLHNTIDPPDFENLLMTSPWNSEITLDRCIVHSPGAPTRWNRGMFWDGAYLAVVDSYFDNLTYFRATNENVAASILDAQHAQISAGTSYSGGSVHTLSVPITITLSGSASGEVLTGWDLQTDQFTVWTPPGLAATCSGMTCVNANYTSFGNGTCNWSDAWPRNKSGWVSAHPTGCFGASNGALNTVMQGDPIGTQWTTEGCNFMIGGMGPGPYQVLNTMIEGAGLPWHHDDSGLTSYLRGDYDYERNTFHADSRYRYASKQSDHLRYFHRQSLEWKGGRRLYLSGNIFDGGWVEGNPASVMVALTAVNGQTITDVTFESNEFRHGPGGLNLMVPTKGNNPVVLPPQRFRFYNNLLWDINSYADTTCNGQPSYTVVSSGWPCSTGWFLQGPWSAEDIIIDHNTFLDNTGRVPSFLRLGDGPVEGVSITNNIISFVDQGLTLEPMAPNDFCLGLAGKALADCKLPGYRMTGNVLLGQSGTFVGTANVLGGPLGSLGYVNSDFSPRPSANGAGADIAALRAAQGTATNTQDVQCPTCVPVQSPSQSSSIPNSPTSTVQVTFKGSVNGATVSVLGSGCNPGRYALPITLTTTTASECSVQVTPPPGYEFASWSDNSAVNPRSILVPSAADTFFLSFSATSTSPSVFIPDHSPTGFRYVPIAPCRVLDTREPWQMGGGPPFDSGETRTLLMTSTQCHLPAANAYAVNVTVVPFEPLRWITMWPAGEAMPYTSVLNSFDGRIKSSAAIIAASENEGINIFATNKTHVVVDVSGYFVEDSQSTFHPLTPCRVVDTRESNGLLLGSPAIPAFTERSFPILRSPCGIPETAEAYVMNFTAIPRKEHLTWMTAWPSGQDRPLASTVNDPGPAPVANSSIVKRGDDGNVSVYGSDDFDLLIDVSGYFASQSGGYSFYPTLSCRLLDTRESQAVPLTGTHRVDAAGICNMPLFAKAIAGVITAVPHGALRWITLWGEGSPPLASTLNAYDGAVTSNFTITPLTEVGSFNIFASDSTQALFDIMGYFAP